MRYIADTTEFQITEPTIVTLGKFDGRHRGHQKLLRAMKDLKGKTGWATAIFTFSIAPAAVMKGEPETVITTSLERRRNMERWILTIWWNIHLTIRCGEWPRRILLFRSCPAG